MQPEHADKRTLAAKSNGPLAGLIIVDLSRILAGPYCTMVLADLGARVIKVEIPGHGDDSRHSGPFLDEGDGAESGSGYFFSINRNKESIALDLKAAADREIFERLLDSADVLVENFRPGVMAKLGYDWAAVHARWPSLILASISGFGQTGPYSERPAFDMVVQAMGGIMSLTGAEGSTEPVRVGISIGDLAAGMFAVMGVQAALIERHRTGVGKYLDVAMFDCQVALVENAIVRQQITGKTPRAIGSRHPQITPFAAFKTSDRHIVIAAGSRNTFLNLCNALSMPDLATDPRFASNRGRTENHATLSAIIEEKLAVRTAAEWLEFLQEAGVPCSAMNDIAALLLDPQVSQRDMLIDLATPEGRNLRIAGTPLKFAGDPTARFVRAPQLDEHRAGILDELGIQRS